MLARGCAVNGANILLVDVNKKGLEETQSNLKDLCSSLGVHQPSITMYVSTV